MAVIVRILFIFSPLPPGEGPGPALSEVEGVRWGEVLNTHSRRPPVGATAVEMLLDVLAPTSCPRQNVGKIKSGGELRHQDWGFIAKSSVRMDVPVLIKVDNNKLGRT